MQAAQSVSNGAAEPPPSPQVYISTSPSLTVFVCFPCLHLLFLQLFGCNLCFALARFELFCVDKVEDLNLIYHFLAQEINWVKRTVLLGRFICCVACFRGGGGCI